MVYKKAKPNKGGGFKKQSPKFNPSTTSSTKEVNKPQKRKLDTSSFGGGAATRAQSGSHLNSMLKQTQGFKKRNDYEIDSDDESNDRTSSKRKKTTNNSNPDKIISTVDDQEIRYVNSYKYNSIQYSHLPI